MAARENEWSMPSCAPLRVAEMFPSSAASRSPRLVASFFCRVEDRSILDRVEFYAQDIRLLEELGYDVQIAVRPWQLRGADVYVGWWWTWGFVPALFARLRRRPVVLTGVFDEWLYPDRGFLARALHRLALRLATVNVFVSRFEFDTVPRSFRVTRPAYCPLTVDTDAYAPGEVPRESFLLCIAGSGLHRGNAKRKCIEELIRAFGIVAQQDPVPMLVIVGRRGSDSSWVDEVVDDVGVRDRVQFTGVVSTETKIQLLQRCAVYLQPSIFEGFGLSILEAMACGACVISSPVGAVPELVGDTAVLVDGRQPTLIAEATLALLADPTAAAERGRRARARAVAEFPFARRRDFFRDVLSEIGGSRSR